MEDIGFLNPYINSLNPFCWLTSNENVALLYKYGYEQFYMATFKEI